MPSGAKKRRAARKKKENEAQVNSDNSSHQSRGNGDPRSQDERNPDGDTNIRASHCHDNNGHLVTEGHEYTQKRDSYSVRPFVADKEALTQGSRGNEAPQKVERKDDSAGRIHRGKNSAIEERTGATENIPCHDAINNSSQETEPTVDLVNSRISVYKNSASGSVPKSQAIEEIREANGSIQQQEAIINSIQETEPAVYLVNSTIPIAETPTNGANFEGPKTSDCSKEKPLVAPAASVAQRTSWWNCCGLLELLAGSSR